MNESHDYLEMATKLIGFYHNDSQIDANELGELLMVAERDGVIDNNEIRILKRVVADIDPSTVDEPMRQQLAAIVQKLPKKY